MHNTASGFCPARSGWVQEDITEDGKLKKPPALTHLFLFWFSCPLLLYYLWCSPAIRSYPNSKYWLHVTSLGSSISWGCRSFIKVLLLRLLKHWEVTVKEEILKKKPKSKWLYAATNIKALSSCHAALLCHSCLPVEELCFTLTCFTAMNYKHFCGLSSLDTAGVWCLSHFPSEIRMWRAQRGWGCLSFLANPRCQQELQHLLLNLEILEKGRQKFTVPCWAGKLFCWLSSSQIAGL